MFYVLDAKRLTALEDENAKLKQLLAEAEPDKVMLKEIASMAREDRRASKNGPPSLLPSTIAGALRFHHDACARAPARADPRVDRGP